MTTEPIRAEISGGDRCKAEGHTVKAAAPVLALCRRLIEAGYDPATPLHAYRGDVLCLKVRSIGYGAKWAVDESRTPRLVRWKPSPFGGGVGQDRAGPSGRYPHAPAASDAPQRLAA
jgi:hypothetical protein